MDCSSSLLFAQKKGQVEGFIKDVQTGQVLPYASVFFEGTTIGAISDDKVYYRIKAVKPGAYKLKTSFVGYQDTTINFDTVLKCVGPALYKLMSMRIILLDKYIVNSPE